MHHKYNCKTISNLLWKVQWFSEIIELNKINFQRIRNSKNSKLKKLWNSEILKLWNFLKQNEFCTSEMLFKKSRTKLIFRTDKSQQSIIQSFEDIFIRMLNGCHRRKAHWFRKLRNCIHSLKISPNWEERSVSKVSVFKVL